MNGKERKYGLMLNKAAAAAQRGNWRESATFYRRTYTESPEDFLYRYCSLSGYTSILRQNQTAPESADHAFLAKLKEDESAPDLHRAQALFTTGLLAFGSGNRSKAARQYSKVLAMSPSVQTLQTTVYNTDTTVGGLKAFTTQELFDEVVSEARQNLAVLTGEGSIKTGLNDPTKVTLTETENVSVRHLGTPFGRGCSFAEMERLKALIATATATEAKKVAGCCKCKAPRSSTKDLNRCSRCQSAYYCSLECQKGDWREHKKCCRKYGQYLCSDIVRIEGVKSKPQLNGQHVEVTADHTEASGRYVVSMIGSLRDDPSFKLKPENLTLVVPVAVRNP